MKKLAYRKAYADAYEFAMKKLAEELADAEGLEKDAWFGDEPFFNSMQRLFRRNQPQQDLGAQDRLVAQRRQMAQAPTPQQMSAPQTPAGAPTPEVPATPTPAPEAPKAPAPTPETPHGSAPAPETPHASGPGGAAAAQTPPGHPAASTTTPKTPKAPKKGFFRGFGGKLGLLATVGLPIASFIGGKVLGNEPTPEEEGYAPPRYM